MKTPETQRERQRRFLLLLPLLVLPFLTLAFWALGGGSTTIPASQPSDLSEGLNLGLPEPRLQAQTGITKLNLYQEARRAARQQQDTGSPALLQQIGFPERALDPNLPELTTSGRAAHPEQVEEEVTQKLSQLTALVHSTPALPAARAVKSGTPADRNDRFSQDVAKLEMLLQGLAARNTGQPADPEMQQINGMLERILDIQHPERVRNTLLQEDGPPVPPPYTLYPVPAQVPVTLLVAGQPVTGPAVETSPQAGQAIDRKGFYGLEEQLPATATGKTGNTIAAAIHETQTVVAGGIIKMHLLQDALLGGSLLPRGSLVYGTCRVSGERLSIEVKSVQIRQAILPVALTAFDLDGLEGLSIPGSINRDAARQGADRAISQPLQLPPTLPSVGAQAASAGFSAAQGLLSRKTRQVRITLKAGYQLLLRDQHSRL